MTEKGKEGKVKVFKGGKEGRGKVNIDVNTLREIGEEGY